MRERWLLERQRSLDIAREWRCNIALGCRRFTAHRQLFESNVRPENGLKERLIGRKAKTAIDL